MRYRELLEAPIADFSLQGPIDDGRIPAVRKPFDRGTTFDKTDQKLLMTDKGRNKIVRAFQNTKQTFRVVFQNGEEFDAGSSKTNDNVNDYISTLKAGIRDEAHGVRGQPGVITVLIVGNLSADDKMPMNAWTLAHKIGHSFQDFEASSTQWADQPRTGLLDHIQSIDKLLFSIASEEFPNLRSRYRRFGGPQELVATLTMKSAREKRLDGFEIFPELIAQYLLTGSVKMNLNDPDAIKMLAQLNVEISNLFQSVEGKVLVEV